MQEKGIMKDIYKGAIILALLLFICYLASFGARYIWFLDLLRHFVFQYFIGAIILGIFFAWRKSRIWAGLMILIALMTGGEIISTTYKPNINGSEKTLKVAHFNKWYLAQNNDLIIKWIRQKSPDIVIIQEADPETSKRFKELKEYPYSIEKIPDNPFGFILLSKFPISEYKIDEIKEHMFNNIYVHANIDIGNNSIISLYSAHPVPPVSYKFHTQRNRDLDFMSNLISKDDSENIIFIGDFNITPYSPFFKDMIKKTGLKNEYNSILPPPTWTTQFYDYILQIPIDHILHKGDLELIGKRRGPAMGSDHYPLIATFAL